MCYSEAHAYVAFAHAPGIGPRTVQLLSQRFGSVSAAFMMPKSQLATVLGATATTRFCRFRSQWEYQIVLKRYAYQQIGLITPADDQYPTQLLHLADPPLCLFVRGNRLLLDQSSEQMVTIVGTRKATSYGQDVARQLALKAASAGMVVVSGMAQGIDAAAHHGALEARGKTIAVLGSGLNHVVPAGNIRLQQDLLAQDGLLVSEYPPDQRATKGTFVARNRIGAALSAQTVVVEGLKRSGALITAGYAVDLGREVMAVPGRMTDQMSEGPLELINNGARPVLSAEEIVPHELRATSEKSTSMIDKITQLPNSVQKIFDLLRSEEMTFDELVVWSKVPAERLQQSITQLEIEDLIWRSAEGYYRITIE